MALIHEQDLKKQIKASYELYLNKIHSIDSFDDSEFKTCS